MQELVERVSLVWREGLVIACFIEEEGCGVNESARYEIDLLRWLGLPRCGITESVVLSARKQPNLDLT